LGNLDNSLRSYRYYGLSDYTKAVHSLIEGLERAFAWRAKVLAKFALAIPMVPESVMQFNHAHQKLELKDDDAMIIEEGAPPAQYLVCSAQLADVEVEINGMMKELMMKLKLSNVLLAGEAAGVRMAISGTALGIRLIPTTSKVREFASVYKIAIPLALSLKSKLDESLGQGEVPPFEPDEIKVFLFDGVPKILAEEQAPELLTRAHWSACLGKYPGPQDDLEAMPDSGRDYKGGIGATSRCRGGSCFRQV
jgi:hypothetical protein